MCSWWVALARAFDYLQAFPRHTVLVVAVELPSLTFQFQDLSHANVISSALFGDGAVAVVLSGELLPGRPRILATESTLFPQTTGVMGFDLATPVFISFFLPRFPSLFTLKSHNSLRAFSAHRG